jgi:DNA-binding transcriptional LysR family regulator
MGITLTLEVPRHQHQSFVVTHKITIVNISSVDLNLFVVLHAVLEERSATKAAARLHITQSAVSNALARLRVLLNDPLVVRTGRGLAPTPRALAAAPRLATALAELEALTDDLTAFDLATTGREWTMAFAELYGPLLLPELTARLRREAPHATLRVMTLDRMTATDALATGDLDLYLGVSTAVPAAWHSEAAFTDDIVGIARSRKDVGRQPLTVQRYVDLPHIHVRVTPERGGEVDDALARAGLVRRVVLTVPHYSSAVAVVAGGEGVASIPRRLAEHYARTLDLVVFEIPLDLPTYDVRLHWHARSAADPGVAALRSMVRAVLDG